MGDSHLYRRSKTTSLTLHQCLQVIEAQCFAVTTRQQVDIYLPVSRLDIQQFRKAAEGEDPEGAGYPEQFHKKASHDLKKVARFESYRGFLFGKPQPGCEAIGRHLGEPRRIIDMMVDQAPDGLEVLRGSSSYMYDAIGSCRLRTAPTAIMVSSVHWNYVATRAAAMRKSTTSRRPM